MMEVPEAVLLRDIVYVFQNIDGEIICYDSKQEAYRIDDKVWFHTIPYMVAILTQCHGVSKENHISMYMYLLYLHLLLL